MKAGSLRQWAAVLFALSLLWHVASGVHAHPGCSPSPSQKAVEKPPDTRLQGAEPLTSRPPHNGRISKGSYHSFEVVYLPYETRIYIYSPTDRPSKAQNVKGEITMQVKGNPTLYRYPLSYVPPIPGSDEGNCLQALVDVTQIRDGDMQVTVQLSDLPLSFAEPVAQFRQVFALSRSPQAGNEFPIKMSDQVQVTSHQSGSIARSQAVEAPCCADCKNGTGPDRSLQVIAPPDRGELVVVSPPLMRAQQVTSDDRAAVESQRFCPVMRQPLGVRGIPWKVFVDGQPVFICCPECVSQVETQPAAYLAEARRLRGW